MWCDSVMSAYSLLVCWVFVVGFLVMYSLVWVICFCVFALLGHETRLDSVGVCWAFGRCARALLG